MAHLHTTFLAIAALVAPVWASAQSQIVTTPNTELIVNATPGNPLQFVYYGTKLCPADEQTVISAGDAKIERFESQRLMNAYPAFGLEATSDVAVACKHMDGNLTLDLIVNGASKESSSNYTVTRISLKDRVYPFFVDVCYKAYNNVDIIETWTEIRHQEKKAIELTQFASAYMPIRRGEVWYTSFTGSWGNEANMVEEPLLPGTKVVSNRDGVRNSHTAHSEVMFSLDGKPQELTGRVIGAALCYGGNYKLRVETGDTEYHKFFIGMNEDYSHYTLAPNELFVTPSVAFSYSNEGKSGVSRNFHSWGREYKIAHGKQLRKVLLNSWEGVYFDINQAGMDQMMNDIASMGGELFVMDDGWFGDKYPRKDDCSSLGDWVVDKNKLPNGIEGLLADAKKHGIKFGIWFEPEMANTVSELYEAHPDWVIKAPKRDLVLGRGGTQVVLDLSNPKVQDFIFKLIDDFLTKYPETDYIKWDANMSIMNYGSQYLPMDKQSHLYIEYHRGFTKVMERIRAKYPDITIQACASGGGRANYGILPYFDEFWVSDDTDALQRVYMQWGTSMFFPAVAMASHISASPNHNTHRVVSLKYRTDVAMSGRLGMEIQPKNMTDDEKDFCRKAIAQYKEIRPIVQQGDIYRLLSPYDKKGAASLMYVTPDKSNAVFYWWKTETFMNQHLPRVLMAGLDPDKQYKVTELNRIDKEPLPFEGMSFSGKYLMEVGLELPYTHNVDWQLQSSWSSRVLLLQ
ncbi:MAG: alpha-galactosidase [Bacteroidales bacterium]|nr:alpha-galactosidase [Bacteroidales bacterium]